VPKQRKDRVCQNNQDTQIASKTTRKYEQVWNFLGKILELPLDVLGVVLILRRLGKMG
jgi:hypothetical protein